MNVASEVPYNERNKYRMSIALLSEVWRVKASCEQLIYCLIQYLHLNWQKEKPNDFFHLEFIKINGFCADVYMFGVCVLM